MVMKDKIFGKYPHEIIDMDQTLVLCLYDSNKTPKMKGMKTLV